jgi:PEP-CTERM motif
MRHPTLRLPVLVCGFILLTWGLSPVRAGFITTLTPSITTLPSGLTNYQYTLTDQAGSTLPAVEFALNVDPGANLTVLTGPAGWIISYTSGDPAVDWSSPSSASDILPGQSAVFSFNSPLGPVQLSYLIVGLDDTSGTFDTNQGSITSPGANAVPEPSTLSLLGTGALSLLGYVWCQHKRAGSAT